MNNNAKFIHIFDLLASLFVNMFEDKFQTAV